MKIAVLGPSPRFLSGISYYTIRLCNALSDSGEDVFALLFRHMLPKRLFPGWKRVGDSLSTLNFSPKVKSEEILDWYHPGSWMKGFEQIKDADVIILEWWTSSVAHMYLFIQLINRSKIPCIIEFHEVVDPFEHSILPIRLYSRIMGLLIRKNADRYFVHSDHDRRLISKQYRISLDQIHVIPHGLYDQYQILERKDACRNLGITTEKVILFFGLIRPYKGVSLLIRAFEGLDEELRNSCTLLIAGEAWEDQDSVSLVMASPNKNRIVLENRYISDDEIPSFFSAADLLVLPYLRASQSGVAHIGISYGLSIIASKVGGLSESLGSYDGTVFINPADIEELKKAIVTCLNRKRSRWPVPEHMQWNNVSGKVVSICRDLSGVKE